MGMMDQFGKYGFFSQRIYEESSKFNLSRDAFTGL